MSWDAELIVTVDGHDLTVYDTNYTHNCNGMANAALDAADPSHREGRPWWDCLDGETAAGGDHLLSPIVHELESSPDVYRAMNPENGWGDYDSFLTELRRLRDLSKDWPSGRWVVSG